jgi:hypothetical protein
MKTLAVELTDEQYARYKASLTTLQGMETTATDAQLIAQLKREASAITYAAEVGANHSDFPNWSF